MTSNDRGGTDRNRLPPRDSVRYSGSAGLQANTVRRQSVQGSAHLCRMLKTPFWPGLFNKKMQGGT
ncbi:MAG: hypothetical protein EHM71_10305 [Zetaproteobacteria bacterium]|nr:MAG: hypothetical protein EHM71_10305 [Zetaproteobacteria bacterium]